MGNVYVLGGTAATTVPNAVLVSRISDYPLPTEPPVVDFSRVHPADVPPTSTPEVLPELQEMPSRQPPKTLPDSFSSAYGPLSDGLPMPLHAPQYPTDARHARSPRPSKSAPSPDSEQRKTNVARNPGYWQASDSPAVAAKNTVSFYEEFMHWDTPEHARADYDAAAGGNLISPPAIGQIGFLEAALQSRGHPATHN